MRSDISQVRINDSEVGARTAADQDVGMLVKELRLRQAELEAQNDELRHTQERLERSRDQILGTLPISAPVGYITVDRRWRDPRGKSCEPATCLGLHRDQLIAV